MEFTGERVVPGQVDVDLWNEHVARYAFASWLGSRLRARKKRLRVLDAGCGSGYGAAQLAGLGPAVQVAGVDLSEEALAYARQHYAASNIRFQQGDCLALPFADREFDLVVAFELIEHLPDAAAFLKEAARVLAPSGHIVVSTPNRRYYSEELRSANPFHTREYDPLEFDELLKQFFAHRVMFVQNHTAAISFFPWNTCTGAEAGMPAGSRIAFSPRPGDEPHFLVAVGTQDQEVSAEPFVFVPSAANMLRERETHIRRLESEAAGKDQLIRQLQQEHEGTVAWGRQLERELQQARELLEARQRELNERGLWAQQLDREIERLEGIAAELQRDVENKVAWARSLEDELQRARVELDKRQQELEDKIAWALSIEEDLQRARKFLDERQAELDDRTAWARGLEAEVERLAAQNVELNAEGERLRAELKADGDRLQAEHDRLQAEHDRLQAERDRLRAERDQLAATVAERTAWAQRLDGEAESLRADMRLILGSIWYRLGKKARLSPVPKADRQRGNR